MNLFQQLEQRDSPIPIVVIGAGKFGCMFLAQARRMTGIHVCAVVDIDTARARDALGRIGWPAERFAAASLDQALRDGTTWVTDDAGAALTAPQVDVVMEITGHVGAAVEHILTAIKHGKHVVNVTVEADAVVGPLLAARAAAAGVVYSMAYGDQPALICELVDWCRTCGFTVTCAGKGTKYLPAYHASTPDTVWRHYGFSESQVASGDYNPRMFNSFLDGTKSAIEMGAVSNATGLAPQKEGLFFPPSSVDELPLVCRPAANGGALSRAGTVEVVSSLHRDGSDVPRDLRWGVYVTFETEDDYVQRCFHEYGVVTDPTGRYAALYRPTHFIGLELGVSVAQVVLRGVATGTPTRFLADVVAVAKRDLAAGETLDGEGGYTVYGKLVPAAESVRRGCLPLGMAGDLVLNQAVAAGVAVTRADISAPDDSRLWSLRGELEALAQD